MATPLLAGQVLAKLPALLHDEYQRFHQEYIQPGEDIFAVAECSGRGFSEHTAGGFFGFFVLTNERALVVWFRAFPKREQVRFYQPSEGFFYHTLTDETILGFPPSPPLLDSEIETRQVQEVLLSMIEQVERTVYSATLDEHLFQCIEINLKGSGRGPDGWLGSVGLWRALFDANEGQAVYNLLDTTLKSGGGQIEATISRDEMLQRLERLASLFQAGMLTEEEFQAGKRRLLGL